MEYYEKTITIESYSEDRDKELEELGFTCCYRGWGRTWMKKEKRPMYSSQCDYKHIGDEPDGCNWHSDKHYYVVKQEDFDKMEIKPKLTKQYRSARYYNFDGFVEQIQKEMESLGWVEFYDSHMYGCTQKEKVFFVI